MQQMLNGRVKCEEEYQKLCAVIPGGVNSPVRSWKAVGLTPMVVESGKEDQIVDVDGNTYFDYCLSWGALLLGHAHPEIVEKCIKRMEKGTTFGITMAEEGELAHKIISHLPSIEKIRFVSSGTEATMSAIRLARGYTKRDVIVKFAGNFHGHADFFLVQAGSGVFNLPACSSEGIPQESIANTLCLPYNNADIFRQIMRDPTNRSRIAAVIVEPIAGNLGVIPPTHEFLQTLREETEAMGALLIFDEVMTGYRVGLHGAQGLYGITPDLTTLAKVIGGGFPAAAFGGRSEIMDLLAPLGPVYQSGTLSGNPVAMVAGLETLKIAETPGFYQQLEEKVDLLLNPIESYLKEHDINACVQRSGTMFTLFFGLKSVSNLEDVKQLDFAQFSRFFAHMLEKGIYIPPLQQEAWFISSAHKDENLIATREAILDFLQNNQTI